MEDSNGLLEKRILWRIASSRICTISTMFPRNEIFSAIVASPPTDEAVCHDPRSFHHCNAWLEMKEGI